MDPLDPKALVNRVIGAFIIISIIFVLMFGLIYIVDLSGPESEFKITTVTDNNTSSTTIQVKSWEYGEDMVITDSSGEEYIKIHRPERNDRYTIPGEVNEFRIYNGSIESDNLIYES